MGLSQQCCGYEKDTNNIDLKQRPVAVTPKAATSEAVFDDEGPLEIGSTRPNISIKEADWSYMGEAVVTGFKLSNEESAQGQGSQKSEPIWIKQGYGEQTWTRKCQYSGSWVNGLQHGNGWMKWFDDEKTFIGLWHEGKRQGQGKMQWPNGDEYTGQFKDDERHGLGKFIESDGKIYDGQWKNDEKDGLGFFTNKNGIRRNGQWKEGKRIRWLGEINAPRNDSVIDIIKQKEDVVEFKLTYFTVHARGEPIRQMLAHSGIKWEDERIEMGDWPLLKPQAPGNKLPFITLPSGLKLGDSQQISRHIGIKLGYYFDEENTENLKVRKMIDSYLASFDKFFETFAGTIQFEGLPEQKNELLDDQIKRAIPNYIETIDARLARGEWLVGEKLTIADFWVAGILYTNVLSNPQSLFPAELRASVLVQYPNFKNYGERYSSEIKEWLENRPKSQF